MYDCEENKMLDAAQERRENKGRPEAAFS